MLNEESAPQKEQHSSFQVRTTWGHYLNLVIKVGTSKNLNLSPRLHIS